MQSVRPITVVCVRSALALCALVPVVVLTGCGGAVEVEAVSPTRGLIKESFREPGRTRLENTFLITMPVAGRIGRISLEPGDRVTAGQELARFDTVPLEAEVAQAAAAVAEIESRITVKDYSAIEATVLVEAQGLVKASAEALKAAELQVKAEAARSDRAAKELARNEKMAAAAAISEKILDDARLDAETALIELRRQEFYRAAMRIMTTLVELGPRYVQEYLGLKELQRETLVHQLAQARSRLVLAEHQLKLASVHSSLDGVVLERYEQGDSALRAGHSLLLLGNLDELEVEVEVLTQDALSLAVGRPVTMESALGRAEISGKVRKIEPAGFTKLSSLGVEQQRVKVIVAFDETPRDLGVGYRLQARFVTGSKTDALTVARSSVLEAPDGSFYVLKVVDGRLGKTPVEIGLRGELELEILKGLSRDDLIVARPDTTMSDRMKVKLRNAR